MRRLLVLIEDTSPGIAVMMQNFQYLGPEDSWIGPATEVLAFLILLMSAPSWLWMAALIIRPFHARAEKSRS